MDQDLPGRDVSFGGRRFVVAIGNLGWRAAEKTGNSVIAQVQLPCAMQVKYSGQRKHPSDRRLMCSQAECKLSARRVSGNAEVFAIELRKLVFRFLAVKEMVCAAKIMECSRPSAALVANAPVFDIQGRNAGLLQSVAEMPCVREIVFRAPVAAVNEKHELIRAFASRDTYVDELIGIIAVRNAQIGIRR